MNQDLSPGPADALLIVDVQVDFLPGGALAVPGGDEVVPILNAYIERFEALQLPVIATRDWHPPDHCSFQAQGGPWPPHCVPGTEGAGFAANLALPDSVLIISKAMQPGQDTYSGFDETELADRLHASGVKRLFIGGLATDYCVLFTVRDALKQGFKVILLRDAIRAVEVSPGDGERAEGEMRKLGAVAVSLEQIPA